MNRTVDLIKQSRKCRQGVQELRAELAKMRQAIHAQRTASLIFLDLAKQGEQSVFYPGWRAGR